jgi:hypothetical protein
MAIEDYRRSNHNDFATSSELKERNWSGMRANSITGYREIWVLGEMRAEMKEVEAARNPRKWEKLIADTFLLHSVEQE